MKYLLLFLILPISLMAQKPELVVPVGHTNYIYSAAYSPDGKYVLTGSGDKTAKLWDIKGREVHTYSGHGHSVTAVAFSPDGKYILTGSYDKTAILWSMEGKELQRFTGHSKDIIGVAFSPNGKHILTGSNDKTARLWDLQGNEIQSFQDSRWAVTAVAFSPDGQFILTGSLDKMARLWTLKGEIVQTYKGHTWTITSVGFSPDGRYILTGCRDSTARLWNRQGQTLQTFRGHQDRVNSASFSKDGQYIVTGSNDDRIRVWNFRSIKGKMKKNLVHDFVGNKSGQGLVRFSPDGQYILTIDAINFRVRTKGQKRYAARIWDLEGKETQLFTGHSSEPRAVAFSPSGTHLLAGGPGLTARLWDLPGRSLTPLTGHTDAVNSVAFSPDGTQLLTGSGDHTARLWDLQARELKRFEGHEKDVISLAFSPDGTQILTGSHDQTARLWEATQTGRELQRFTGHRQAISSVKFSPDGKYVLTGSMDSTVRIWDIHRGQKEVQYFNGHSSMVFSVAYSPDGKHVISGSDDNTIRMWEAAPESGPYMGKEIQQFPSKNHFNISVAYSPDGTKILSGGFDNMAHLWDAHAGLNSGQGKKIRSFRGHSNWVWSVAFSQDGKYVLTGSGDHSMKLWETQSGNELATLFLIGQSDWVVTSPSGLFDASPGAMGLMYYRQGMEIIALEQLKERYFEPHLLSKLLGFNMEPIKDVSPLNTKLDLYPELTLGLQGSQLSINLKPREGGMGRVALYIGNKEVKEDLDPSRRTSFQVDLSTYASFFAPGQPTPVGIKAWDQEGGFESQMHALSYTLGSSDNKDTGEPVFDQTKIHMYALCVGSGDYNGGSSLDLSYAEQDAQQMAIALEAAGKELFLAAAPKVTKLTTCKDCPETPASLPSKAAIKKAILDIASQAKPQDVVILYLSGHGLNFEDYWYYLTYEMSSAVLTDKGIRESRAISSKELKEWMAMIPAQKQVLIIDACASGKLNQDFDLLAQKEIPSSQVRALNRLGSRAGLFVISASTADQVSYEASPYGMGLLTYSLLQGISGAALFENEFVEVKRLFDYSEETVPKLADYINKHQKPMTYAPVGSESFPIGKVTPSVKQKIQLSEPKPLFSQANFGDPSNFNTDILELSQQVNQDLREYNYRGTKSPLIFVEGTGLVQAYKLSGTYAVTGETIQVQAGVFRDKKLVGEKIELTGELRNLEKLSQELIQAAYEHVKP